MKTTVFRGRVLAACLLASALATLSGVALAATNEELSARVYGSGKATLRYPDDNRLDSRYGASQAAYCGSERLTYVHGTVSRVRLRDYFELRASDGRTYRVVSHDGDEDFNVSSSDRVEVRGHIVHDVIVAHGVRETGYGYDDRQVDFPATVTSLGGYYRLTVRGDNGRTYTIDARSRLPYNLSVGDYVRISGTWNGSTVTAEQIVVLRDGYGDGGGYGDRYVDFPGTVSEVDRYRNTLRVRGENGVTYPVSYTGADQFERGDRVRVVGTFDGYAVRASAVYRRW